MRRLSARRVVIFCVVVEDTYPNPTPFKKVAIVNLFGAVKSSVKCAQELKLDTGACDFILLWRVVCEKR